MFDINLLVSQEILVVLVDQEGRGCLECLCLPPCHCHQDCQAMLPTWMIVLRKTKVMISQNMNCDLQMYRTVRRFLRFHLETIVISLMGTIKR